MKNKYVETVAQSCSVKKTFLEISQNSQENTCARVPSLIKLQASSCNFIKKEALAQVFSCTFWETPKNSFFHGSPPVAASDYGRFPLVMQNLSAFIINHLGLK